MSSGIRFVAYRDGGVLRPWGEAAYCELERVPGKPKLVTLDVRQPRNPQHLSLYWVILQKVAATDPWFSDAQDVHEWVKVRLGMFKEYKDYDGRIIIRTKSIAVEAMDQLRFRAFFDRAMWLLSERLGVDPEELLESRAA